MEMRRLPTGVDPRFLQPRHLCDMDGREAMTDKRLNPPKVRLWDGNWVPQRAFDQTRTGVRVVDGREAMTIDPHVALRNRELSFPFEVRINNPKLRNLRDAYFGMMGLNDAGRGIKSGSMTGAQELAMLAARSNARGQLSQAIKALEPGFSAEDLERARSAARWLFEQECRRKRGG